MIKINIFTFNIFAENTLVVWDVSSLEAAIIDPGNSNPGEDELLTGFVDEKKLIVKFLINTHCHIDHILGCRFVKNKYNPVYLSPEDELPLIKYASVQAEQFDLQIEDPPMPDEFIKDGQNLQLGNSVGQFLFTPGHSPGEVCIYFQEDKLCITGDVLFNEGIGRTDLWGGNYDTLLNSIRTKLFTLPDDVKIFPGHGGTSTIGYEKIHNPFLQ